MEGYLTQDPFREPEQFNVMLQDEEREMLAQMHTEVVKAGWRININMCLQNEGNQVSDSKNQAGVCSERLANRSSASTSFNE